MSNIRIIADSTCDLDPSLVQSTGFVLERMPLTISVAEKNYLDGEEITIAEIYELMRNDILPKTAQIPYYRVESLFRSILENGDDLIYIAFSSKLSGCYDLATLVANELCAQYPKRHVAIIDSKGGSGATGLIVLQALRMARDGLPFETIESEIRFMADNIEHVFSVDNLQWLAKGGRIPHIVGYVGSKLHLHPILNFESGCIVLKKMVQGKKKAIRTVAEEIIRRSAAFPNQLIAISHADDQESAHALEALIKHELPECTTTIRHIGGVLGVHLGLRGIGAFCLSLQPNQYRFI